MTPREDEVFVTRHRGTERERRDPETNHRDQHDAKPPCAEIATPPARRHTKRRRSRRFHAILRDEAKPHRIVHTLKKRLRDHRTTNEEHASERRREDRTDRERDLEPLVLSKHEQPERERHDAVHGHDRVARHHRDAWQRDHHRGARRPGDENERTTCPRSTHRERQRDRRKPERHLHTWEREHTRRHQRHRQRDGERLRWRSANRRRSKQPARLARQVRNPEDERAHDQGDDRRSERDGQRDDYARDRLHGDAAVFVREHEAKRRRPQRDRKQRTPNGIERVEHRSHPRNG